MGLEISALNLGLCHGQSRERKLYAGKAHETGSAEMYLDQSWWQRTGLSGYDVLMMVLDGMDQSRVLRVWMYY